MADNGTSATDIITYIGVPLAVLGGKAPHPHEPALEGESSTMMFPDTL
jgi:hypothetical protein